MSAARPWVRTQQSKWTPANQSGLPAQGELARTAADFTTHCFMWNGMLALKNNWPQSSHVMARGGGIFAMPRRDGLSIVPPARLGKTRLSPVMFRPPGGSHPPGWVGAQSVSRPGGIPRARRSDVDQHAPQPLSAQNRAAATSSPAALLPHSPAPKQSPSAVEEVESGANPSFEVSGDGSSPEQRPTLYPASGAGHQSLEVAAGPRSAQVRGGSAARSTGSPNMGGEPSASPLRNSDGERDVPCSAAAAASGHARGATAEVFDSATQLGDAPGGEVDGGSGDGACDGKFSADDADTAEELGGVPEVGWAGWARAVYERDPESHVELAFAKGQALELLAVQSDGWSIARTVEGATGLVPSLFVRDMGPRTVPSGRQGGGESAPSPGLAPARGGGGAQARAAGSAQGSRAEPLNGSNNNRSAAPRDEGRSCLVRAAAAARGALPPSAPPRDSRRRYLPARAPACPAAAAGGGWGAWRWPLLAVTLAVTVAATVTMTVTPRGAQADGRRAGARALARAGARWGAYGAARVHGLQWLQGCRVAHRSGHRAARRLGDGSGAPPPTVAPTRVPTVHSLAPSLLLPLPVSAAGRWFRCLAPSQGRALSRGGGGGRRRGGTACA